MFRDFFRAVGQLPDPRILRVIGGCVLLSLVCIVATWFGVNWLLQTPMFETSWLEAAVDWLVLLTAIVLTMFLFPLLASVFIGVFLESIANAVEQRHYPELAKAAGLPFWSGIGATLRFLVVMLAANVLLLFLLLFPPIYPVAYVVVNGYLISREYFELVAFRRLPTADVRALRARHGGELLLLGMGTAFLFTLPIINFVAPILATATMVHRFEAWRAADDSPRP